MAGQRAHRAVNLSRMLQGLPYIGLPVEPLSTRWRDRLGVVDPGGAVAPVRPLLRHVAVVWTRELPVGGAEHRLFVWAAPGCGEGMGGSVSGDYRYCGQVPISLGVACLVDAVILLQPVVLPGGWLSLQLGLCELGQPPFRVRRLAVKNVLAVGEEEEWPVTLLTCCTQPDVIVQGSWIVELHSNYWFYATWVNGSSVNHDECRWTDIRLVAGNYTLELLYSKVSDGGKVEVWWDAELKATLDMYVAAPAIQNLRVSYSLGLQTPGKHVLAFRLNGSSGAWFCCRVSCVALRRVD